MAMSTIKIQNKLEQHITDLQKVIDDNGGMEQMPVDTVKAYAALVNALAQLSA